MAATKRNGSSTSASCHPKATNVINTAAGTAMATKLFATVCAKKYSIVSTSCVAIATRSPVLRRCKYPGARRSSLRNRSTRIRERSRNAISWEIHDSSHANAAVAGARDSKTMVRVVIESPSFTFPTISALTTPMPIRPVKWATPVVNDPRSLNLCGRI